MKSWVVRPGDGVTVGSILRQLGEVDQAVADGRVFVGKVRAKDAASPVSVGDEVRVAPFAAKSNESLVVVDERDGRIAVAKPAGIPTIPDHGGGANALVTLVAEHFGVPLSQVHPTSRLDRDVSGVVVFALTKEARDALSRARDEHRYQRRYVALARGVLPETSGTWAWPIGRAKDPRHRAVNGKEATHAKTHYAVVGVASGISMLALAPITGRTHQLRVHAAFAKAPLLGDGVYGRGRPLVLPTGKVIAPTRIALHAARVTIAHEHGAPSVYEAAIPPELAALAAVLGFDDAAWKNALSCILPER